MPAPFHALVLVYLRFLRVERHVWERETLTEGKIGRFFLFFYLYPIIIRKFANGSNTTILRVFPIVVAEIREAMNRFYHEYIHQ